MRKSSKRFKARPGSAISNKQALVLGSEFDAIVASGAVLTPAAVVVRAAEEDSPLHAFFEWNDMQAARRQRLEHARYLIGAVVEVNIEIQEPVRSYQSVRVETHPSKPLIFKRRDMLSDNEEGQVARALFTRLLSIVREAEALGLSSDRNWGAIIKAVHAMRAASQKKSA